METSRFYTFGPFRLDPSQRTLLREGRAVQTTKKAFETLVVLVENSGGLVTKDALMTRVWPDTVVEESTLSQNIFTLRKLLGKDGSGQCYIETVPKLGYRFVAPVSEGSNGNPLSSSNGNPLTKNDPPLESTPRAVGASIASDSEKAGGDGARRGRRSLRVMVPPLAILVMVTAGVFAYLSKTGATDKGALIKSLAVLPFKPLDPRTRDEYLELGMADALITKLSVTNRFVVRPTSSIRRFSDLDSDPVSAGRELKVEAVLEGSVQEVGGRIRVSARLVAVSDGRALWAGEFNESSADVLQVQDSISEQIVGALRVSLSGQEKTLLAKRYTRDPQAYEFYEKGRFFWNKRTPDALRRAIDYFQQAITKDQNYALAYAGLADSYTLLDLYTGQDIKDAFEKSREAAQRALELDNSLAAPHASLAYVHYYHDWDWAGAEQEFKRAIAVDPNYATAHQWYAEYLFYMQRFDESIFEIRRAHEIDPVSLSINTELGSPFFYMRRYDEAMGLYRNAREMDPSFPLANYCLALCYCQKGMYQRAIDALGGPRSVSATQAYFYAVSGSKREALQVMSKLPSVAQGREFSPYLIAAIHAALGETDASFQWLDKAYEDRDERLIMLRVDPHLDAIRQDARFAKLLKKVGLDDASVGRQ